MFGNAPVAASQPQRLLGRDAELHAVVRAAAAGVTTVVHGRRGIGKTSVLNMAAHRLAGLGHRTVGVSASLAPDGPGLIELVADRFAGPRSVYVPDKRFPGAVSMFGREESRPTDGGRLLSAVDRLRDGLSGEDAAELSPRTQPVVVVDDLPGRMLDGLFGLARDALWSVPCSWIVACDTVDAAQMTERAALFFEDLVELPPLTHAQAAVALRSRLDDPDGADLSLLDAIAAASDGTPRSLIMAARQALGPAGTRSEDEASSAASRRSTAQTRLAELGRSPAMLAAAMQGMGGTASASDPRLLDQLGWSRGRAAQVMRQLAEHGFATAADARPSGTGRPRTMYRLVEELR